MQTLIDGGTWTPSAKTAYVVTSNDPYSLNIANSFRAGVEKIGWKTVGFDSSRCRRPTGAACSSRSATPSPA